MQRNKVRVILGLLVMAAGLAAGYVWATRLTAQKSQRPAEPPKAEREATVTLYFADDQAMYLVPETRQVRIGAGRSLAEAVFAELVKGPEGERRMATIPPGTRLLRLEVVDGVAYVNLSREAKANHSGGSAGEQMTVYSIVDSLARLPGIKTVQFLLEGEKRESIWGHLGTDEPLDPRFDLIASV